MQIIPAILTDDSLDLQRKIKQSEEFTNYAQIDFMDGEFVPSKSVMPAALAGVKTNLRIEAHLMMFHPQQYFKDFQPISIDRVTFHYEATPYPEEVIEKIKEFGWKASIAINPETSPEKIKNLLSKIDSVLIMTVNPGYYGQKFMPEALSKVALLRAERKDLLIGVDGGIKMDNLELILEAGFDYVCVGSAIFSQGYPLKNFQAFQRKAATFKKT